MPILYKKFRPGVTVLGKKSFGKELWQDLKKILSGSNVKDAKTLKQRALEESKSRTSRDNLYSRVSKQTVDKYHGGDHKGWRKQQRQLGIERLQEAKKFRDIYKLERKKLIGGWAGTGLGLTGLLGGSYGVKKLKDKQEKKAEIVFEKISQEKDPLDYYLGGSSLGGSGLGLSASSYRRGDLTGRETLYHVTSKKNIKNIKEKKINNA